MHASAIEMRRAEQGLHQLIASGGSDGGTAGQMATESTQHNQELEQENRSLQEQNERWKRVNNQLYQTLVSDVLLTSNSEERNGAPREGEDDGHAQRGTKRKSA